MDITLLVHFLANGIETWHERTLFDAVCHGRALRLAQHGAARGWVDPLLVSQVDVGNRLTAKELMVGMERRNLRKAVDRHAKITPNPFRGMKPLRRPPAAHWGLLRGPRSNGSNLGTFTIELTFALQPLSKCGC